MRFHGGINTSEYLDFSVNVPVRQLDEKARRYIDKALLDVHLYPSIDNRVLCERLGEFLGARVLLGNGATQLIYASARLFIGKRVVVVEPAFTEYVEALKRSEVHHLNVLDCIGDEDAMAERIANFAAGIGASAVYLCNPNNPVGYFHPRLISKICNIFNAKVLGSKCEYAACGCERVVAGGCEGIATSGCEGIAAGGCEGIAAESCGMPTLVVDESFIDFVDGIDLRRHSEEVARLFGVADRAQCSEALHKGDMPVMRRADESMTRRADESMTRRADMSMMQRADASMTRRADAIITLRADVLVIRSLTKAFSVPGLRLGYAAGSEQMIEKLACEVEPWSVGAVPAAFMEYVLDNELIFNSNVNCFRAAREKLAHGLAKLGFYVFPSDVNYLLFKAPKGLNDYLRNNLLNIRTCADFMFLGDEYYRVTVRSERDNAELLELLGNYCQ